MSAIAPVLGQRRLTFVVVLVGAVFVLALPARQLIQQRERIGSLESRLVELRAENDLLEQDVQRLSDPAELEVLARERLGLVKPGERAYFVEPVKPKPKPRAAETDQPAFWERGWDWFTSLVRGGS